MSNVRPARTTFEPDLIDRLVAGRDARAVFERNGILDKLRDALSERFPTYGDAPAPAPETGDIELGGAILPRLELRFPDLSERVISLHTKGYQPVEIQRRLSALLGEPLPMAAIVSLLADLRREALDWQSRALDPSYPIVVFERVRVKWRDGAAVRNRLCHFALGFQTNGPKEVLGLWFEDGDDRAFWAGVLADLKGRGVVDILYLVSASPHLATARAEAFPAARALTSVGEYVRQSLELATTKDRSVMAKTLRQIHGARNVAEASTALARFESDRLGQKYPAVAPLWRRHWAELAPFFEVPLEVRRVMASTFAADALRRGYARTLRAHGHMTSTAEATALMYLAVRDSLRKWRRPQREWHAAKTQLAVLFPERFVAN